MCGLIVPDGGNAIEIMPSKMEVASQHCDTVPNKTKDKRLKGFVKHDSRARHPVQSSSVRGTLRMFWTVEINRKVCNS